MCCSELSTKIFVYSKNIVHTAKIEIMCQVVAYKRLKTMRIINRQAQKVVG